jgi:hypothetical protein
MTAIVILMEPLLPWGPSEQQAEPEHPKGRATLQGCDGVSSIAFAYALESQGIDFMHQAPPDSIFQCR